MFSTGEFSRIARVSKRLLQFYDEQRLFTPAYVDPVTGYRRYGAAQLGTLNRILALKELGLSLTEIHRMLDRNISRVEVTAMLQQKKQDLEQSLTEGISRLRSLEVRLSGNEAWPDVVLKSVPELHWVGQSVPLSSSAEGWAAVYAASRLIAQVIPKRSVQSFSVSLPGPGFETENLILQAGVAVKPADVPSSQVLLSRNLSFQLLPPQPLVATAVIAGGPPLLPLSCQQIGTWIEANGLRIVGIPREVFLEFPVPESCESVVIETQFPVDRT